jgi:hypothetical protein
LKHVEKEEWKEAAVLITSALELSFDEDIINLPAIKKTSNLLWELKNVKFNLFYFFDF